MQISILSSCFFPDFTFRCHFFFRNAFFLSIRWTVNRSLVGPIAFAADFSRLLWISLSIIMLFGQANHSVFVLNGLQRLLISCWSLTKRSLLFELVLRRMSSKQRKREEKKIRSCQIRVMSLCNVGRRRQIFPSVNFKILSRIEKNVQQYDLLFTLHSYFI